MTKYYHLLKAGDDGQCQISVRYVINRSVRPQIKTGVFIYPELWDAETGSIKSQRKGRASLALLEMSTKAEEQLNLFELRMAKLIRVGSKRVQLTSEWFQHCMDLIASGELVQIESYDDIVAAERKHKSDLNLPMSQPTLDSEIKEGYRSKKIYDSIIPYCNRRNLADSRVCVYKVLGRQLKRFEMYMQNVVDRNFSLGYDIMTNEDVEEFRTYLRHEHEYVKTNPVLFQKIFEVAPQTEGSKFKSIKVEERSSNYITGTLKKLAAVFHWLQETGRTSNDPFRGVDFGRVLYGRPIYIYKEERDAIANYDLSNADLIVQQQRDIFIFQCLVGCRVGDLINLTKDNITGDILEYVPSKTRGNEAQMQVRVPLNPQALDLIKKYKGVDKTGKLFPFISSQRYNDRIKEVFTLCGITRMVSVRNPRSGKYELKPINEIASSHMARRTFVGIAYKLVHDPNLIGRMSGHAEGSKAFARYRDIDDEDLRSITSQM